mmetsp:Transcript_1742/g.3870  ORF Transcript_1742/g.3870 Transcript_1742/m.3870 type:complete len:491 (-) Transcript_1742:295-1767(-)|eukprot:CAMPEP_0206480594 /NCGR_PEP_ID=MMETSP0324_2-20121206/37475_1 /ASSEMBLY_ACC=CAM_ASM_000836 /TAXON_ID=2866 /ORGANISM="Crypthecodinium cohnii, Strain Seligo" /LENGTH=490 /DNA_ID=CAMNT_0053957587 /DNA_START=112 /DNA_END=1584 /DNA_ORIENTATION=-
MATTTDAPTIKAGFIVGKDTDLVEDEKYTSMGGDISFLKDLPDDWRVDPDSHEYLKDCEPGTKGAAHCDVALAWWIHKHCPDIKVDIIGPGDLSLKRLKSNDFNFSLGYNAVNLLVEDNAQTPKVLKALETCGNIAPDWGFEQYILQKSNYMRACMNSGVPMAPTIFSVRGERSAAGLLDEIKDRGWKTFVMKQSESGFSLGFLKLKVEDCEKDPSILENYFNDYERCPEFIVQEAIEGFTRNWETRCFWFNGEFLYAIANMAAVSTEDGAERIITGDDIPEEFLENAKRIGKEAIKCLPKLQVPNDSGEVPMVLVRTDIGCSDSQIFDKDYNWDPNQKTFFLNEIEPSSTTYFVRHLKFDCIPMYGKLYAETARKMKELMLANQSSKPAASAKKTPRAKSAVAKRTPTASVGSSKAKKTIEKAKAPNKPKAKAKGKASTSSTATAKKATTAAKGKAKAKAKGRANAKAKAKAKAGGAGKVMKTMKAMKN